MANDTGLYSGVRVVQASADIINSLYQEKKIKIDELDGRLRLKDIQNCYVILNDKVFNENGEEIFGGSQSVLTRVQGDDLVKLSVSKETCVSGVRPRNKEQIMAFDALLNKNIGVVALTGSAGTGKTLCTLAAALHLVDEGAYKRIILTRQMQQVGKQELGILPGEVADKFGPYLKNYMCNFEHLLKGRQSIDDLIQHYSMEFVPFQLIRGASWPNTIIIGDELQNADYHEMLTLGTRVGENSKLVIMGDLMQRDVKIAKEKTGLYGWVNNEHVKSSGLTASINLIKNERSEISQLFAQVFEG
jgi:PhoH-like ATPase